MAECEPFHFQHLAAVIKQCLNKAGIPSIHILEAEIHTQFHSFQNSNARRGRGGRRGRGRLVGGGGLRLLVSGQVAGRALLFGAPPLFIFKVGGPQEVRGGEAEALSAGCG